MSEIGEERNSGIFHKNALHCITHSPVLNYACTAGDGGVKVIDMTKWDKISSECIPLSPEDGTVKQMQFTSDGQILTLATSYGCVQNFLMKMPTIHDKCGTRVAYLSSLRELSVVDTLTKRAPRQIQVSIEPAFVALGPGHVAVGMNNRVWFYSCDTHDLVSEQEYSFTVESVKLNAHFAAILCEGKATVHLIDPKTQHNQNRRNFPDPNKGGNFQVTDIAMTPEFFIFSTQAGRDVNMGGTVEYFYLDEFCPLPGNEYRHDIAITKVYPNPIGSRVIFLDAANNGFLYDPVTAHVIPIPQMPPSTNNIMWDHADWGIFMTNNKTEINVYSYSQLTMNGPVVCKLGPVEIAANGNISMQPQATKIPRSHTPVLVHDGNVWCQVQTSSSGQLFNIVAVTHDQLKQQNNARGQVDIQKAVFSQTLALLRLNKAWKFAQMMNSIPYWKALATKAMEQLNIEMAIKVYRELGDAGMVMGLESIMHIEDKNLLAGHVALLFANYAQAQELFLMSTKPTAALEMRRDLLHWDQALKLARTLAEDQVADISVSYAQQLEVKGEYEAALHMYESGCNGNGESSVPEDRSDTLCIAGIARTSLRLGDLRRGTRLAHQSKDRQLCKECAMILEGMKQYSDAAALYEEGGQFEKAAAIYILHSKNLSKAEPLMEKINTPRYLILFAKAKEQDGQYEVASRAYEKARDMDSVVRLQLKHLNNPEIAFGIVRQTSSSAGAVLVAEYCKQMADYGAAIEFLLIAQKSEEAFQLAQTHDQMAVYAKALGESITQDEATDIARYYEQQQNPGKAGEFYTICGKYKTALKLFLQCGEREMDKAIDVVGKAKSDTLTHTLIDFLMGETDGVPKDPNFIFRLYMALGNYSQAAKTAIIIARQEQELGNYKVAHSTLYETQMELENNEISVPRALRSSLLLLHSYMLIKKLVKMQDHLGAARMLIRVSKNISKFPSHVVEILTSTVIECLRGGLRASAYEYACILMRPEHRSKINPKFKKKIEGIVRRPNRDPEEEELSPCPFTGKPIPVTELVCPDTKNDIPFCVVTGQHMVLDDWCICPNSKMPALYSKYLKYLETEKSDPVCGKPIDERMLEKISDPAPLLERYNSSGMSKKKEKSDDGGPASE